MLRLTPKELAKLQRGEATKPGKYRAKPETIDGIRFASRLEARRYCQLKVLQRAGEIDFFLRQVGFDIPGGKYRLDFMTFKNGRVVAYEEVKGNNLPLGAFKIRAVERVYGITITMIRK